MPLGLTGNVFLKRTGPLSQGRIVTYIMRYMLRFLSNPNKVLLKTFNRTLPRIEGLHVHASSKTYTA